MDTFEYDGQKFKRIEKHNDRCDGCWFWQNNITCSHSDIPECKSGIFVKI